MIDKVTLVSGREIYINFNNVTMVSETTSSNPETKIKSEITYMGETYNLSDELEDVVNKWKNTNG